MGIIDKEDIKNQMKPSHAPLPEQQQQSNQSSSSSLLIIVSFVVFVFQCWLYHKGHHNINNKWQYQDEAEPKHMVRRALIGCSTSARNKTPDFAQ